MSADIARNPSTVSPHAEDALPPLRLRADGLGAGERASLGAILDVLAGKLPRTWVAVDDGDADLYVYTRGARRSSVRAGVTGLLVREDEPQGAADELWMPVPLRVMPVLDLLHGAHDRLRQAQAAQVPRAAAQDTQDTQDTQDPHAAGSDEKTLASSLARLFVGAVQPSLRVRVLGYGTLYVCPASDCYRTDFEIARVGEALDTQRFILTAISAGSSELTANDMQERPLDELLWAIGLRTARERQPGPAPRQRLRSWPDFGRLAHDPRYLQASAALSTAAMDRQELAAAAGLDEAQADRFLHACQLCGLLETVADAAPAPSPAAAPSRGGLFDRLWRRLVK